MKENSRKLHCLLLPLGALALGASLMAARAVRQQDPQQPAPDNTKRNKDHTDPSADQQKMNPADRAITQKIRKAIHEDKSLSTYAHNIKIITGRQRHTPRASTVRGREEQCASKGGGNSRPGQRHQSTGSCTTKITEIELGS